MILLDDKQNSLILLGFFFHFLGWRSPYIILVHVSAPPGITIPRLELLASVILSRLTATVYRALESVIQIEDYYCWTDSKTAYYWIKNGKEHKQLVQNRVDEVLQNSDPDKWFHVPGIDNPADIGTRGALPSEIENNDLWWHGPS